MDQDATERSKQQWERFMARSRELSREKEEGLQDHYAREALNNLYKRPEFYLSRKLTHHEINVAGIDKLDSCTERDGISVLNYWTDLHTYYCKIRDSQEKNNFRNNRTEEEKVTFRREWKLNNHKLEWARTMAVANSLSRKKQLKLQRYRDQR